ncbi:YeiH family protein [Cohnella sp.]|uniref:YeiH family protein n=1 Tax=Cohnella sp. TaxID=1883426 RepID=UPI0035663242
MLANPIRPVTACSSNHPRLTGILLTLSLALAGWAVSLIPGPSKLGPLACALLLAAAYRHRFGYPHALGAGVRFSSGTLLRAAIVLFGLKLDIVELLRQGLPLLLRSGASVAFSLVAVFAIGRLLRADRKWIALLAIGTAICGAAAIAAAAPLLRSKDEDTAISAGLIAVIGTVFATAYTLMLPWLPLSPESYGIWSGLTLHEIAHVAMAAAPGGPDALADGLLAKLCRVALLVPVCLAIAGAAKLRSLRGGDRTGGWDSEQDWKAEEDGQAGNEAGYQASAMSGDKTCDRNRAAGGGFKFPWFLVGFIAASLFGSYALPALLPDPKPRLHELSYATTLLLGMAMAGLGLNVSLRDLRSRALRPLAAMLIASVLLSALTYWSL